MSAALDGVKVLEVAIYALVPSTTAIRGFDDQAIACLREQKIVR